MKRPTVIMIACLTTFLISGVLRDVGIPNTADTLDKMSAVLCGWALIEGFMKNC